MIFALPVKKRQCFKISKKKFFCGKIKVSESKLKINPKHGGAGFELTYGYLESTIHFSFFTARFFTPSLKITKPTLNIKKEKEFFP